MSLAFKVLRTADDGGRRGRLYLPHGVVETPVFMPVGTAATVKAVPQDVLETLGADGAGAQIILANTYHLYLRPGHELIRRMGGVHRFMSWTRPMLTDSGGFQVFSLSKLRKISPEGVEFRSHLDGSKHMFSPEHSIAVQIALGADVIMVFDECVEHPASFERTRESMGLTHAWAERSVQYFARHKEQVPWFGDFGGRTQSLFGIVQGGMYPELRRESAELLVELDLPGYAIGGLAVGEPREVTREIIARTLEWLPADKPRYVMGVGYPDEIKSADDVQLAQSRHSLDIDTSGPLFDDDVDDERLAQSTQSLDNESLNGDAGPVNQEEMVEAMQAALDNIMTGDPKEDDLKDSIFDSQNQTSYLPIS